MYNGECNRCNTISEELESNVNVLREMLEVRVKACGSLGMDDVMFIIDDICVY